MNKMYLFFILKDWIEIFCYIYNSKIFLFSKIRSHYFVFVFNLK